MAKAAKEKEIAEKAVAKPGKEKEIAEKAVAKAADKAAKEEEDAEKAVAKAADKTAKEKEIADSRTWAFSKGGERIHKPKKEHEEFRLTFGMS